MNVKKNWRSHIRAEGDRRFWVHEGLVLSDLQELRNALAYKEISESQFMHHVTDGRNDFANWIELVLCDEKCAAAVRKIKSFKGLLGTIDRNLKHYKKVQLR